MVIPLVFIISFAFAVCSSPCFSLAFSHEELLLKSLHGPIGNFEACLSSESYPYTKIENITHKFWSESYSKLLVSSIRNLRFNSTKTPKPYLIITPENPNQVSATVICAKRYNLEIRILGAGHDYEGLSFVSPLPFVVLDTIRFRKFKLDLKRKTAWVGAGLTLGELYYKIANESLTHAFPAGVCPTVGLGGHISGGGQGMMMRNFGLATDNVLDARIVDAEGRILNRSTMGEDLFWAIRGGGAASFAVILEWKLRIVEVPPVVTAFAVEKPREHSAARLVFRWQENINVLPNNIMIRIVMFRTNNKSDGEPNMSVGFHGLYLGPAQELLNLLERDFPELEVRRKHCTEMSWINTTLYFDFDEGHESLEDLLDRQHYASKHYKAKSDYVTLPIPEDEWEGIFDTFVQGKAQKSGSLLLQPYGGKLSEIATDATPFPHRAGTLYIIHYHVFWRIEDDPTINDKVDWLYKMYDYMTDFVEKPRTGYQNYRDLDLGKNEYVDDTYGEATSWGRAYFKDNFKRLAQIKHRVDPDNFFRHEQSIPPLRELYALG